MTPLRLTAIAERMMTPEFAIRIGRLREAVNASAGAGLREREAAEILDVPLPVARLIIAYHWAACMDHRAHGMAARFLSDITGEGQVRQ